MGWTSVRRATPISSSSERGPGVLPVLLVLLVIASLVATCAGPTPSPSQGTTPANPSPVTPTSASPGVTPLPTQASSGDWTKLDLPVLAQVASLEATKAGASGVAPTTTFKLTSLDGTAARQLAARLVVTPTVKLAIAKATATVAELRPATALRQGQIYRFELRRTDGTAEAAWAVQAAWPLRVASSIPGDGTTNVPRDTGIELTFDQAGVRLSDVRDRFSISPRVTGRFEQHGLTFVFVPLKPLARSTLYTVTIRHGLPLPGTGMSLAKDVVTRFETTGTAVSRIHLSMTRPLFDAATDERPVIGVNVYAHDGSGGGSLESLGVVVHRLPSMSAAMDAYRLVRGAPDWTERTSTNPIRTSSLQLVLKGTLALHWLEDEEESWFRLPRTLRAGWYVVTATNAGISRQAVLQVTDLAAFSMVTDTQSLVWVNNLRTNRPVAGARVSLVNAGFGRTNAGGLATGRTPGALLALPNDPTGSFAVVRAAGRSMFVPLYGDYCEKCGGDQDSSWWHLLTTDRSLYRVTDTVNVWGVLRDRDTGKVPGAVSLVLMAREYDDRAQAPVASANAAPDASGSWLARLSFTDLPPGEYVVSVRVGSREVTQSWITVGPIVKPAWKIELTTPHRAVLSGTDVPLTATAAFFEGTPVTGAALEFAAYSDDEDGGSQPHLATTDASGLAGGTVRVTVDNGYEEEDDVPAQWSVVATGARAHEPEEGDIRVELPVAVFRSSSVIDAASTLKGTTLSITGAVHDVAFSRFDAPAVDLWDIDPRGTAHPNAKVTVQVTEVVYVTRKTGSEYDFIAKRVVPVYETTTHRSNLGSRTATTGPDGSFKLAMTVKGGDRSYETRATYVDSEARPVIAAASAQSVSTQPVGRAPYVAAIATGEESGEYSVGDQIRVRFRGGIESPQVQRFLFAVMARGLRGVSVQGDPRFSTRFSSVLVPDASIAAVRFTGTGYEVVEYGYGASIRTADRTLRVQLTSDRGRYAPGDRATVSIRTLDANGRPTSASVFVRAVDEKLFAMGAATIEDPMHELYQSQGAGLLAAAWSHESAVAARGGEGGDTTGGGGNERADFRDWLLSRLVTTGSDGRATVSFDLSDDLTSWRFIASAVTSRLEAGYQTVLLPVSLSFFADAIVAPEYLSADRPVIRVRAFGTALKAGDTVTFTVSSDTLPMAVASVQGKAFQPVEVSLPTMTVGTHRLRIQASTGSGAGGHTDTLVRTFAVVTTRAIRAHTETVPLATGTTVGGGTGLTSVTLVDSGRGRVVPLLRELASSEPFRADTAVAAAIARDLLATGFGIPDNPSLADPDLAPFQQGGVALVPYASPDLDLSAMAALSGAHGLNREQLHWYFDGIGGDEDGPLPTDRALLVLLGRAAIGEASMGEVTAAAALADLTPSQRVTVALAAVAVGDEALARQIERDLLGRYGERLGSWVRVKIGSSETTAITTARLAIVAAALGDPIAADMDAEIVAHPPVDTLVDLERAIAATYWVRRMPKTSAAAAVTIDGKRSVMTITGDEPVVFEVTPAQREGLRIDPVSGSVLVISQWEGPVAAGDLTPPDGQSITRTVKPAGQIGATETVVVTFQVTLGPTAEAGCWQVTDFAPSGLMPIAAAGPFDQGDDETGLRSATTPWRVVGQRVDFCVERDPKHPAQTLRYLARVVTSGTYQWEPAVLQSSIVPEQGVVLPAFDVTIKGLGS